MKALREWLSGMDFRHGIRQILLSLTQLLNVMSNPFSKETWCDESLSARCGRLGHRYPYKFWKDVINSVFELWDGPNHCESAYEKERERYNSPPDMRT